jgi:hypothetical protein
LFKSFRVKPNCNNRWSKTITGHSKKEVKVITQVATGHANLKRHRFIMGMEDNPNCEGCGMQETAIHFITECPKFVGERFTCLGRPTINTNQIQHIPTYKILKFCKVTKRWEQLT